MNALGTELPKHTGSRLRRAGVRAHDQAVPRSGHYDPWFDIQQNWPWVRVRTEPMTGDLLGEVREDGTVIALRAGTSGAQRRCTLAHEIVHLERGLDECGPWLDREEFWVHLIATRRLITLPELIAGIRDLGGTGDLPALAQLLDVDSETLGLRLSDLEAGERRAIRQALARSTGLWTVA